MARALTEKQKAIMAELGSVLGKVADEAERDNNFAAYLSNELGDCWGISIDEMMTAVQCRTAETTTA